MKTILKSEEVLKLVACYLLSLKLGFSYWTFFIWILAPDLSMLGYIINARIGAIIYNIFHHLGIALIVGLTGLYTSNPDLQFAGLILLGHSSMDRIFGYGLKYSDSFKHTHLGQFKDN